MCMAIFPMQISDYGTLHSSLFHSDVYFQEFILLDRPGPINHGKAWVRANVTLEAQERILGHIKMAYPLVSHVDHVVVATWYNISHSQYGWVCCNSVIVIIKLENLVSFFLYRQTHSRLCLQHMELMYMLFVFILMNGFQMAFSLELTLELNNWLDLGLNQHLLIRPISSILFLAICHAVCFTLHQDQMSMFLGCLCFS